MKITLAILLFVSPAFAKHVNGYVKQDGTYVAPYERTAPNNTRLDNYSTQGNTNPYTGQQGTVNPYGQQNTQNQNGGINNSYGNSYNNGY